MYIFTNSISYVYIYIYIYIYKYIYYNIVERRRCKITLLGT